jgi:hypothetical protein
LGSKANKNVLPGILPGAEGQIIEMPYMIKDLPVM